MTPTPKVRSQSRGAAALLGFLWVITPACVYPTGDSRVFLTTDPPGADVALNGKQIGKTTPAVLELGGMYGDNHKVTFSKDGYDDETRELIHHRIFYTSDIQDAVLAPEAIPFPLWFTFGDFFAPFGIAWNYEPHELHVKLYRKGEFAENPHTAEEPGRPESR